MDTKIFKIEYGDGEMYLEMNVLAIFQMDFQFSFTWLDIRPVNWHRLSIEDNKNSERSFTETNTSRHPFSLGPEREIEYLWNTNFDFLLESEERWLGYETARKAISSMSQQVSEKLLLWLQ